MKGAVFTIFESFIIENHGEDTWDDIIDQCQLKTSDPFVDTGSYPDEDLLEIVGKTVKHLNVGLDDALMVIG